MIPPLSSRSSATERFLAGLGLLRRDPRGLRYAGTFLRSLLPGRSAIGDAVPMMPFRAIDWLRDFLRAGMSVFEYGSGGSTVFFANRAERLVSVEHDPDWYARTHARLQVLGLTNCTYVLQRPDAGPNASFSSTDELYQGKNFATYVRTIEQYPDGSFDLVSVDGRARVACVLASLPKVKRGGFLLLDDTYRDEYAPATDALAGYRRIDFPGLAPYNTDLGLTTVWEIAA